MTASRNEINSNFYQLVDTDDNGNVLNIKAEFLANVAANPAGNTNQVQFNNNGVFGASENFSFDPYTNTLFATNLTGDGSNISNISGHNVSGIVENANVANIAQTAQGLSAPVESFT